MLSMSVEARIRLGSDETLQRHIIEICGGNITVPHREQPPRIRWALDETNELRANLLRDNPYLELDEIAQGRFNRGMINPEHRWAVLAALSRTALFMKDHDTLLFPKFQFTPESTAAHTYEPYPVVGIVRRLQTTPGWSQLKDWTDYNSLLLDSIGREQRPIDMIADPMQQDRIIAALGKISRLTN